MSRKPMVNIVANQEGFTTGSVGKKLTAVKWRSGDIWYVARVGDTPQAHLTEHEATRAFLLALGISGGAS